MLDSLIEIASEAGQKIMAVYDNYKKEGGSIDVKSKGDGSPLTLADKAANQIIVERLKKNWPDIPVISEEEPIPPYESRKHWKNFWLVDPLDGTKEFISKNGEFTVNIALIENGNPTHGVILAPAKGLMYAAKNGEGSKKSVDGGKFQPIHSTPADLTGPLRIVESRSHPSPALQKFIENLNIVERLKMGSSLKFCLVAEGSADIYPRLAPTMEWDVAAGDCIYRNSSPGLVSELTYGKPDLRNTEFLLGSNTTQSVKEIFPVSFDS